MNSFTFFKRFAFVYCAVRSFSALYKKPSVKTNAESAKTANQKRALVPDVPCEYETKLIKKLAELTDKIDEETGRLESEMKNALDIENVKEQADAMQQKVIAEMQKLRAFCDEAETMVAEKYWPFPNYGDLLFYN